MQIEFCRQESYLGSIDIEDYGNCAIEANNDDGLFWYLVISTSMGFVRVMEYGPIDPTSDKLEDSCICCFSRMEFDGKKVVRIIDNFLNKSRKSFSDITQAREISKDDALAQCKSLISYMKDEEAF